MAITRIGSGSGTTTATVPTHAVGDLILIYSFRDANATPPSLPAGYTTVGTQAGTTCGLRVGYKIATATNDTSGTWTNATETIAVVYRPSSGNTIAPGAFSGAAGTTNSVTFPALTLTDTSGNSWVVGGIGHRNTTTNIATAPTGLTNVTSTTAALGIAAVHDSNAGVTAWSSTGQTITGTASGWTSFMVELVDMPPALINRDGASVNIASSGSGASITATISTTLSNNYLTLTISALATTLPVVTGVTSSGLTWARRSTHSTASHNIGNGPAQQLLEVWGAYAPSPLTSHVVTATFNPAFLFNVCNLGLQAWNGIDQTTPWDVNVALPALSASAAFNTASVPTGSATTTNANTLILASMSNQDSTTPTAGAGFTLDTGANNGASFSNLVTGVEHKLVASAQAASSVAFGGSVVDWILIVNALQAASTGGSATTMPAATGAAALGGQVAKLAYGRVFPAATGAFALSGNAAGLAVGHKFAAVTGSFTLNGQAAGLQFGHRLVAVPGAFALAGQPAILRYSGSAAILTALPGAVVLSGVAAKLAYARKFVTVTGSFVLSGQNAMLAYARVLIAAKSTFTLNGVAATLRAGRGYAAASGAFTLNGQPVNFRYTRVFPATVGVFNLASAPANLIWSGSGSKLLPAMRGQFVLNGQAAGSRLTRVTAALPGSFVLAGQAAGLRKDRNLSAAKGVFALLGNSANMIYVTAHDRTMSAQRGSLLLTGVNANLIANQLEKQPGPIEFGRPVWLRAW